jgi:RNA-directed DNA polymerase
MSQLHLIRKINEQEMLEDLFDAYFDARKNKRNTINALVFEKNFESNLFTLFEEIMERRYEPKRSICFIVDKPVKREIFAANFRDRVVHHFIYNYIYPVFEKILINDTYSCRKGKGVHYGIKRVNHFIRSCSDNYQKDCYVLKMDIKEYFMSINRDILFSIVKDNLQKKQGKINFDLSLILYLLKKTIYNDPTKNCIVKGKKSNWANLPKTKSLFGAKVNCGLPIGNLTSQLFGNIYLNDFDHFMKKEMAIKRYGRYVDDFVVIHDDKEFLKSITLKMDDFLQTELRLNLHPKKFYLQDYDKGVLFLGAVIKPFRIYIANRTKGNFYTVIKNNNILFRKEPLEEQIESFVSSINSYLGTMMHWNTYKLRCKMLKCFLIKWGSYFRANEKRTKITFKYNISFGLLSECSLFAGFL